MSWSIRKHSPQTWEKAVQKFFNEMPVEEWTIPGLCINCGITTKTFYEYAKHPEYSAACDAAKDMINHKREKMVEKAEGYGNGILFLLRVNGYQDTQYIKQEMDVHGTVTVEQFLLEDDEEIQA